MNHNVLGAVMKSCRRVQRTKLSAFTYNQENDSLINVIKNELSIGSSFKVMQKSRLKEKSHGFPPVTQFQLALVNFTVSPM